MNTQTKTETVRFDLTNVCVCEDVDDNGNAIVDGNGYALPPLSCYGCYEDEIINLNDIIIKPYLLANGIEEDTLLRIDGSNMDWTRRSGYAYANANTESIVEKLSLNTEWILRFALEDGKLSVVRSSHDELGAGFVFRVATEEEVEDNRW